MQKIMLLLTILNGTFNISIKHKQIDVAVLDFSKAFDVVPRQRLLGKLQHYGINGHILKWISEFLSGRTQCVVVDGAASSWSAVESGVPQGTVLGPLLFLLYINDLPDCVESQVRLFADDCLLYRTIEGIPDQLALQSDLTKLQQWADLWGMQFNPGKYTILTISHGTPRYQKLYTCTLCGQILQHASEAKYLGVTLSIARNIWRNSLRGPKARVTAERLHGESGHPGLPSVVTYSGLNIFRTLLASAVALLAFYAEI